MKRFVLIGLCFVAVLFMACDPYPRESERMEATLRQADSVYKEGENDTALFIPGLAEASSYFAEKKQYEKAALSALYNGYAEKDLDKEAAMTSFKEAERFGETADDSLTIARALYQIGRMLFNDYMHKEALDCFQKAEIAFKNHYVEKSLAQNSMACCYIMTKEYDSAALNLELGLTFAEKGNSVAARTKALNNYAVLFKMQGEYNKALDCLHQIEPDNDEHLALKYLNLGDVFGAMGEADSAAYYFLRLEQLLDMPTIKAETVCSGFVRLSKWAELQGNMKSALAYRKEYEKLLDDIRDKREQRSLYRIQQKYDYEALQNEASRDISLKQQWIIIISLISTLLFASLALAQINLAKKRKQEATINEKLLHFLHRNETLTQSNTDYAKALSDALEREMKSMMSLDIYMKDKKAASLKTLELNVFGNNDHWEALLEIVDKVYPGLWNTQLRLFPDLTENEQKTLLLSRFWLTRQEEALLLGTTVNMVDKYRNRVRKKTRSQLEKAE